MTTTTMIHLDPTKRHDFVHLFDATDSNPNGDPDAGNLPRTDPQTLHGLVSDGAIKRKIRDWVELNCGNRPNYLIFIQNKGIALNTILQQSHEALFGETEKSSTTINTNGTPSVLPPQKGAGEKQKGKGKDTSSEARQEAKQQAIARRNWLCEHYYDIRTFGAVLNTGDYPSGQVCGPVQVTIARSIDPIVPFEFAITRVAITRATDDKETEMGSKAIVPYALYKGYGFVTPHFAQQTGFSSEDLRLFWTALQEAWRETVSAIRPFVAFRGLYIFSHENPRGNAPSHTNPRSK